MLLGEFPRTFCPIRRQCRPMMSLFTPSLSALSPRQGVRHATLLLALAVLVGAAAAFVVPSTLFIAALLGVPALGIVVYILWRVFVGSPEPLLLGWVLLFPLGYFFLSYPTERAIVTFDRTVVGLLLAAVAFTPSRKLTLSPLPLRKAGLAWGAYLVAVAISMVGSQVTLSKVRLAIDALVLPAFLGWWVIRSFEVRRHLRALHALTSLMVIYTAGIGIAEVVLGEDLLKLPGGGLYLTGTAGHFWVRPNGPFGSDLTLGMVGLIALVFLVFLRHALGDNLGRGQLLLHWVAIFCALACSQISLFRSLLLTIGMIVALEARRAQLFRSRAPALIVLFLALGSFSVLQFVAPEAWAERTSADSIWGRIAQDEQTLELVFSHPLVGVGFGSFADFTPGMGVNSTSFKGFQPADSPHNNLGGVLAESGLLAFVPFILSQAFMVMAFYRLRMSRGSAGQPVWRVFLYLFLTFWITGMAETSFQDLTVNLWFMFAVACLYKYGLSAPSSGESVAERAKVAA
jgi:O-antigen ligase